MGYDADLVIWDRHPLRVGASPLEVFIEGNSAVSASPAVWRRSLDLSKSSPPSRSESAIVTAVNPVGCSDVVLKGIVTTFIDNAGKRGEETHGSNMTAVIRDGRVVCVGGAACADVASTAAAAGIPVVQVNKGYMLPVSTIVNS